MWDLYNRFLKFRRENATLFWIIIICTVGIIFVALILIGLIMSGLKRGKKEGELRKEKRKKAKIIEAMGKKKYKQMEKLQAKSARGEATDSEIRLLEDLHGESLEKMEEIAERKTRGKKIAKAIEAGVPMKQVVVEEEEETPGKTIVIEAEAE